MNFRNIAQVVVLGCVLVSSIFGQANLFESSGDVGLTPEKGRVEFDNSTGEYRVTGGGENVWGTADAFHFVWKKLSGDVALAADVRFLGEGVVAHRKAALMIRQSLDPDSAYADVALHGDGLTSLQFRPSSGAATQEVQSSLKAPVRLRIERRGNSFTLFAGAPNEPLKPAGPVTVALQDPVYIGLAVCSHKADVLETAVFSNVRVESLAPQGPPRPRLASKITIFDLATRQTRSVYQANEIFEAPNWSRDGKHLLVNARGRLFRLPVDGSASEPEPVNLDPSLRCNNDHDYSPDGKLIALSASTATSRGSQIYVASADGSNLRRLVDTVPSYFHGWSPDGKYLSFVGQREGKFNLFRVPLAGGPEERLTSNSPYDDGPDYSPDGKWIYFNSNRSGNWDIWRMPASGAGPDDARAQQVTSDELEDWFPHPSPNGKLILVFSFPKGTETHNERMPGVQLRLMKAPGAKPKPGKPDVLLTFFGGQGTINVNSWSPDSRRFAFVVYEPLPDGASK
jgi:TolB protein